MEDIWNLFKETIAEYMENDIEAEMEDSLGYGKYDYGNKSTDNNRNGYSKKNLRTSFGDVEISVPRDRKGKFEPQLIQWNIKEVYVAVDEASGMVALGQEVPQDFPIMAGKLGESEHILSLRRQLFGILVHSHVIPCCLLIDAVFLCSFVRLISPS